MIAIDVSRSLMADSLRETKRKTYRRDTLTRTSGRCEGFVSRDGAQQMASISINKSSSEQEISAFEPVF